jgi:hypothetical protein
VALQACSQCSPWVCTISSHPADTFLNITDVLVNFSSWLYIQRTSKYVAF